MTNEKQWTLVSSESDRKLEKLFQCSLVILDQEGRIVRIHPDLASWFGYDAEELVQKSFTKLFQSPQSLEDILRAGKTETFPAAVLVGRNGERRTSEYSVYRLQDDEEERFILALHEISGGRKLNLLQRFAASFIRDVNLGVLLVDTKFMLNDISDTACRVFGMVREHVIGRPLEEVFAAVPVEHQLVQRTILDGVVIRNHAVAWMNGQERHDLLMDSSLLKDMEGRKVGAYVIFKDVTNLRSLEQQVQRSDRLAMIGQIAAGTAHEIRNPLTSIKGFLQVLKKTLNDNGMKKEHAYTELMLNEIDRINELVSEFLLLSKPKHIAFTRIDVAAVIREILPIINNEAILHGVIVEYESSLDLPLIVADRELLKQVFINICKNGIEAMGNEGGTLTITEKIDAAEQRLTILIQDSGPGIPAFLIDKIFDPFFTTKEEGTGLGLSVCQRIIHDIGGTLRVSSKGYGTIFIVSIPYSKV